jgi:hypothetical protein
MNLQELNLNSTPVTDAGMVHLKAMRGLKTIYVTGTAVTPAALKRELPGVVIGR